VPETQARITPQRLGHPRAPRNPPLPSSFMSSVSKSGLSPVAALCLRLVRGWLGVVSRGKGGELRNGVPYTRLKATEVQQQLEVEQGVTVSSKTVQRALTQLVETGHLSRRQLYKHRYNRTYWYAPGEQEQQLQRHRPSVVAKQQQAVVASKRSPQTTALGVTERTPVSLQVLQAQLTHSPLKTGSSQTTKQPQTGETPCGQPGAQEEAVSKAWGKQRSTAQTPHTGGYSGRLQQAQNALGLLVERAHRLQNRGGGSGFRSVEVQKPLAFRAQTAQASGFLR